MSTATATDETTLANAAPTYEICEHIKDNGVRCGSPAIRGRHFCYFHSRAHSPASRLHRHYRAPIPETIESLQLVILQVTEALGAGRITDSVAGKLLYSVQLSTNLLRMKEKKSAQPLSDRKPVTDNPVGAPCKPSVGLSGVVADPTTESTSTSDIPVTEISPAMEEVLAPRQPDPSTTPKTLPFPRDPMLPNSTTPKCLPPSKKHSAPC